ncbi:unnamed protein product [Amoebophrya sp. A120]|nr:unnamed protein product [Amoebophrya sp. A120]|eukprot:GSA120T00023156001.1
MWSLFSVWLVVVLGPPRPTLFYHASTHSALRDVDQECLLLPASTPRPSRSLVGAFATEVFPPASSGDDASTTTSTGRVELQGVLKRDEASVLQQLRQLIHPCTALGIPISGSAKPDTPTACKNYAAGAPAREFSSPPPLASMAPPSSFWHQTGNKNRIAKHFRVPDVVRHRATSLELNTAQVDASLFSNLTAANSFEKGIPRDSEFSGGMLALDRENGLAGTEQIRLSNGYENPDRTYQCLFTASEKAKPAVIRRKKCPAFHGAGSKKGGFFPMRKLREFHQCFTFHLHLKTKIEVVEPSSRPPGSTTIPGPASIGGATRTQQVAVPEPVVGGGGTAPFSAGQSTASPPLPVATRTTSSDIISTSTAVPPPPSASSKKIVGLEQGNSNSNSSPPGPPTEKSSSSGVILTSHAAPANHVVAEKRERRRRHDQPNRIKTTIIIARSLRGFSTDVVYSGTSDLEITTSTVITETNTVVGAPQQQKSTGGSYLSKFAETSLGKLFVCTLVLSCSLFRSVLLQNAMEEEGSRSNAFAGSTSGHRRRASEEDEEEMNYSTTRPHLHLRRRQLSGTSNPAPAPASNFPATASQQLHLPVIGQPRISVKAAAGPKHIVLPSSSALSYVRKQLPGGGAHLPAVSVQLTQRHQDSTTRAPSEQLQPKSKAKPSLPAAPGGMFVPRPKVVETIGAPPPSKAVGHVVPTAPRPGPAAAAPPPGKKPASRNLQPTSATSAEGQDDNNSDEWTILDVLASFQAAPISKELRSFMQAGANIVKSAILPQELPEMQFEPESKGATPDTAPLALHRDPVSKTLIPLAQLLPEVVVGNKEVNKEQVHLAPADTSISRPVLATTSKPPNPPVLRWGLALPYRNTTSHDDDIGEAFSLSLARAVSFAERKREAAFDILLMGSYAKDLLRIWTTRFSELFETTTRNNSPEGTTRAQATANSGEDLRTARDEGKRTSSEINYDLFQHRHVFLCSELSEPDQLDFMGRVFFTKPCGLVSSGAGTRLAFAFDFLFKVRKVDLVANFDADLLVQVDFFNFAAKLYGMTRNTITLYSGFKSWFFGTPYGANYFFNERTYDKVFRLATLRMCFNSTTGVFWQDQGCGRNWDEFFVDSMLDIGSPTGRTTGQKKKDPKAKAPPEPKKEALEVLDPKAKQLLDEKAHLLAVDRGQMYGFCKPESNSDVYHMRSGRCAEAEHGCIHVNNEGAESFGLDTFNAALLEILYNGAYDKDEKLLRLVNEEKTGIKMSNTVHQNYHMNDKNKTNELSQQQLPETLHEYMSTRAWPRAFHWSEDVWELMPAKAGDLRTMKQWASHLDGVRKMRVKAKPLMLVEPN